MPCSHETEDVQRLDATRTDDTVSFVMQRAHVKASEKALLGSGKRNWNQLTDEHDTIDFVYISSADGLLANK